MKQPRGNCYVSTEALWHILGGRASSWQVKRLKMPGDNHWFLKHRGTGEVLDPSVRQFKYLPNYQLAVNAAFMTREPSKRARALMQQLTWQ